jgi:hypothetical protein
VKGLFEQFEKARDEGRKEKIAREAIQELKIHDALEEEIFYPAVRGEIDEPDLMNEAEEEHHMVRVAIAELDNMQAGDERFEAKFTVLAEMVRHHIKEEEGEMLPEAKKSDADMEALAEQMMARKKELLAGEVPESAEARMVAGAAQ